MSILRLGAIRREIGTFVILDDISAAVALGRAHRPRRARTGPARRRCSGSRPASTTRTAARSRASAACASGSSLQETHLDPAFMAAPDLRIAVRGGADHLERMEAELRVLEQDHRVTEPAYEALQHEFDVLGGYTLDQRVDETLSGLGFARDEWSRPPVAMSGGQQTRAALARLVIADPDLLLLDEPTNHLDLDALEWIEEHLRRRAGSLLVASHDRAFLDATVTRIWELRDRRITVVPGRLLRLPPPARSSATSGRPRTPRARAEPRSPASRSSSSGIGATASTRRCTSTRPASIGSRPTQVEAPKARSKLRLPATALAGGGAVPFGRDGRHARRAGRRLPTRPAPAERRRRAAGEPGPLVSTAPTRSPRAVWLAASRGDRIGIVGPNGAGKTTLLRTIAGDLHPLDGRLIFGQRDPGGLPRPAARRGDPRVDGARRDPRGDAGHAR